MEQEQEGVIKYRLSYTETKSCVTVKEITELNAWRSILHRLRMIGQFSHRYQGYGFGNVSVRAVISPAISQQVFIISGTQTGAVEALQVSDYCRVLAADTQQNSLWAEGPVKPSSEALTHAAVYTENNNIGYIMHVHCPDIWNYADRLGIVVTDPAIAYGTPEMAMAVSQLVKQQTKVVDQGVQSVQGIFAMGGHEDGVIAYASTAAGAGQILVHSLSLALSLGRS